jgi:hypothetical protein
MLQAPCPKWTQLIYSPEPSGGCNAARNEPKLLVVFCPIEGMVESASILLRGVFLLVLSAIIVLFAGWIGKVL